MSKPVAWIDAGSLKSLQATTGYALRYLTNDTENLRATDIPLYLEPPTREPLSEEEIYEIFSKNEWKKFIELARAIEKAHGIEL